MAHFTQEDFPADILHAGPYLIQLEGPMTFGALPRSVMFERYTRGGEVLIYVPHGTVLKVEDSVCFTSEKDGFAFPRASIKLVKSDAQERIWPPQNVALPRGRLSRSSC